MGPWRHHDGWGVRSQARRISRSTQGTQSHSPPLEVPFQNRAPCHIMDARRRRGMDGTGEAIPPALLKMVDVLRRGGPYEASRLQGTRSVRGLHGRAENQTIPYALGALVVVPGRDRDGNGPDCLCDAGSVRRTKNQEANYETAHLPGCTRCARGSRPMLVEEESGHGASSQGYRRHDVIDFPDPGYPNADG